jgi:hypothetical protein
VAGSLVPVSVAKERLEPQGRRAGGPRLSPEGGILRRPVSVDLTDEFQAALDAVSEADPRRGGGEAAPDD